MIRTPGYMSAEGNADTDLFEYPDGFEVVCKYDLTPGQQSAEVLVAAVGRVVGAPVAPVVAGEGGSVIMQRLPGRAVSGTRTDPGARAAMEAIKDSPGARKLGLLDVLTGNWDRPGNWLQDGDHVYGFDHAEAFHRNLDVDPRSNPFASHYVESAPPGSPRWVEWKPNDLSRAELDSWRAEIVSLRPLFEEHARPEWGIEGQPLDWHDKVLSRLDRLREHATRP